MIELTKARQYCKDDVSKIENYEKAMNDTTQTWHCHHRLETFDGERSRPAYYLIMCNMYFNRPADELIFLTPSEHQRLHHEYKQLLNKQQKPMKRGRQSLNRRKTKVKKENL